MSLRHTIARVPLLGRLALMGYRTHQAWLEMRIQLRHFPRWLLTSRETTNFTYDLEPLNESYMAEFVAAVTGVASDVVVRYMQELRDDAALAAHVVRLATESPERYMWDVSPKFGRRLGWYAFVRITRPRVVVETGIDKGLGSCVLASALLRNRAEGHPGRYYGTEINRAKGFLFREPYSSTGEVLYGDSITTLRSFAEKIDLFINDSDHSQAYEAEEYRVIADKLSPRGLVIGDNAHCNDELLKFAHATGRRFLYFDERPRNHWFRNAGIGVAYHVSTSSELRTSAVARVEEPSIVMPTSTPSPAARVEVLSN